MRCPGYIDVCSDLIRGDLCSIVLLTMWLEILCFLSSLDFVMVGRNSIVATTV